MKTYQPRRLWIIPYWILLAVTFCIVGFFLTTTAMGYRYNKEVGRWQKTSMIVLTTDPKDSVIQIDGEVYTLSSTKRVTNLLPGTYRLRISKDEYIPWEQVISLRPGLVVELDPISLFLSNPVELTVTPQHREALLDPISDGRLRVADGELYHGTRFISRFANPPIAVALLSTNRHVAYIVDKEIRIMDTNGQNDQLVYQRLTNTPTPLIAQDGTLIFQDGEIVRALQIR